MEDLDTTTTEAAPAAPKRDTKRITLHVPYKFTDAELVGITKDINAHRKQITSYEEDFESLKADYKSRVKTAEVAVERLWQKMESGQEMREADVEVEFNFPRRGVKTVRALNLDGTPGDIIREEDMSPMDLDRGTLPGIQPEAGAEPDPAFDEEEQQEDPDAPRSGTLAQTEGGENAGETPMGEALDAAAAASKQDILEFDLARYGDDYRLALVGFKKQATKDGWSVAAIKLISDQVKAADTAEKAMDVLRAHCKSPAPATTEPAE